MEALRVEQLSKNFGGIHAVRSISFKVESGEHLAIIGPNGAGKTTLFNMLCGQMPPSGGKIYFFEKDITHMPDHKRTHLGMSRSFQIANLFFELSVLANITLALQGTRPSRFQIFRPATSYKPLYKRAEEILSSMDLWDKRNELVNSISYGEQRKLEIALSLASNPKLLLLDEPSCGLTSIESADITNRIHQLGEKVTVILIAHDMDLVFGVAQRIMVMHYGELIVQGTCQEIQTNAKVKEIYMGVAGTTGKC
jgi:branched-chain amino acid transport system ATP-binding protein